MRKILYFIFVVALLCSISNTGFAADTSVEPIEIGTRMTYIRSISTKLSITSTGLSTARAKIYACSGVDKVRISMYLQRYDNGWKMVKHWRQDFDAANGSLLKKWYVMSGYNYRVITYFYAYDGSNSECTSRSYGSVWY